MAYQDQTELRERSVGELLKQLSQETSTLVRQELDLVKAEMTQKGKRAGVGAGILGGAGVAGLMTLIALTLCLIFVLDTGMPSWLAALVVTAIWAGVTGVLALTGKSKVQEATPAVPEQTVETVKEDIQWAKSQR